jgi:16S rRNA (cytosine967-C5)-methyltransferase
MAVAGVCRGRSLTDELALVPQQERPGVQALSFHVLRWLGAARCLREQLVTKKPSPAVDALLLSALALLWPASSPPYASHTLVNQSVTAARRHHPGAEGFVNAVLRRFLREYDQRVAAALRHPLAQYNHPAWWIEELQNDWGEIAPMLLSAAQHHPPMMLRVNARLATARDYAAQLRQAGIDAHEDGQQSGCEHLVTLHQPCPVAQLPGFADGLVSVQDRHAQLAAPLLLGPQGLPPGARVLDACAAPGGKTAHLLELADLRLLALDSDAARLRKVDETLQRLRLRAETRVADAAQPVQWWDGQPFDAILLDAPCSASGIARRHPDIRWLRQQGDIPRLASTQATLLDALWPLLKPGGRLLYATCSVFKQEGQHQVEAFLQRHHLGPDVLSPQSPGHLLPLDQNDAMLAVGSPILSGDGFFYSLLIKP